jgi:hypothetical protein
MATKIMTGIVPSHTEASMTDNNKPDPLLWAARRERAKRWLHTDLKGYPTLSDEDETEETLAAEPKPEQVRKGKTDKE